MLLPEKKKRQRRRIDNPLVLPSESIKSMNGAVRLMSAKYGLKRIMYPVLWTEPSRQHAAFRFLLAGHAEWRAADEKRQWLKHPYYLLHNHCPGMTRVLRKSTLTTLINKFQGAFPSEFEFFPRSFDITIPRYSLGDSSSTIKHAMANYRSGKYYICKPSRGHQGDGICIVKTPEELAGFMSAHAGVPYVAQEYVARPLLLDGYKFDMRIYVLVSSVAPLQVCTHTCDYKMIYLYSLIYI